MGTTTKRYPTQDSFKSPVDIVKKISALIAADQIKIGKIRLYDLFKELNVAISFVARWNLDRVDLQFYYPSPTNRQIILLIEKGPNIKILRLGTQVRGDFISDDFMLGVIANRLPKLVELSFQSNTQITDEGIKNLPDSNCLRNLYKLDLRNCKTITEPGFRDLIERLCKSKRVWIKGGRRIKIKNKLLKE